MAFAERAYYQYTNPDLGTVDRVEIHEEGYGGGVTMLKGPNPNGIDFSHRDITSTQREYLSIFENQIIMGVLNLTFWVTSTAIETLVTDIADAPAKNFKVVWERDSTVVWQGFKHGRVIDFPEKDPTKDPYLVTVQFRDFEILKGIEYSSSGNFIDNRQKIITSFVDIFNQLGFSEAIKTHTSWQCEGTTVTDDFLNQVYHDTYVLRDYASDGYLQDQKITYYEALLRVADPMLVIYQWKGFNIFQISDCKTPTSMKYAVYNSSGTQVTSTTADRSYAITAKISSNNTSYPAIKKAVYEFLHNSGNSEFDFDIGASGAIDFNGNNHYSSLLEFTGNGDEVLTFIGSYTTSASFDSAKYAIRAGEYALDGSSWVLPKNHSGTKGEIDVSLGENEINTTTGEIEILSNPFLVDDIVMFEAETGSLPANMDESTIYYVVERSGNTTMKVSASVDGDVLIPDDKGTGIINVIDIGQSKVVTEINAVQDYARVYVEPDDIPAIDDSIEIVLRRPSSLGRWTYVKAFIENPTQAGESIEYRLTQGEEYSDEFKMNDSYFGDGPYPYSRSSYRTSTSLADITTGWRRRGDTTYISYARLKLNEVLDYQRVRQLKKTFKLNGEAEPDKVGVYETNPFMYVGGQYNGRWTVIGVKVEENTDG